MRFFLTFCDWHADPIIANEVWKTGVDFEYISLQVILGPFMLIYLGFGLIYLCHYTSTLVGHAQLGYNL